MAPGTRPRAGRWGWIQAQASQADDSNGLVTWNHLRKRRRSPKRLLGRPRMRSEPLSSRVTQTGMGTARQRRWSELWTSTEGQLAVRALPNKGWFSGGQMLHRMPRRPAFALVRAHVEPRRNRTGDPILAIQRWSQTDGDRQQQLASSQAGFAAFAFTSGCLRACASRWLGAVASPGSRQRSKRDRSFGSRAGGRWWS
jgi:hypothetical protein